MTDIAIRHMSTGQGHLIDAAASAGSRSYALRIPLWHWNEAEALSLSERLGSRVSDAREQPTRAKDPPLISMLDRLPPSSAREP